MNQVLVQSPWQGSRGQVLMAWSIPFLTAALSGAAYCLMTSTATGEQSEPASSAIAFPVSEPSARGLQGPGQSSLAMLNAANSGHVWGAASDSGPATTTVYSEAPAAPDPRVRLAAAPQPARYASPAPRPSVVRPKPKLKLLPSLFSSSVRSGPSGRFSGSPLARGFAKLGQQPSAASAPQGFAQGAFKLRPHGVARDTRAMKDLLDTAEVEKAPKAPPVGPSGGQLVW